MPADVAKFKFRLVLLGSHETGKTSILNRFLFKKFETKYKPTVEDLFSKVFDLGSIELHVDFLDTSGSMQFPAMRRLSITTGSAFMIVYALDDENSYEVLKMCMAEIQEIRPDFQEIPIVFAGNKCDIPREKRKILKEVVSNYVHYELPRLRAKVIECSCKDSINIDNLFRAYLSLAQVSLSSTVSVSNVTPTSPTLVGSSNLNSNSNLKQHKQKSVSGASGEQLQSDETPEGAGRVSSVKDALGVRKSCDASILSSLSSSSLRKGSHQHQQQTTPPPNHLMQPKFSFSRPVATVSLQQQQHQSKISRNDNNSILAHDCDNDDQVNLATAIQTKLNVSKQQHSKPRSRSLIWRPVRKSRAAVENSECRVT